MARYATYIRASTDDQETTHQRAAIDDWLDEHTVDTGAVDHYADLGHSGSDPGREQFRELIDAIETGQYEHVVVREISRLARLGSIYQRFFETCEDKETTVAITDGWVEEVRPDGTGKLIADISAAVALRKWFLAVYTYIRFNASLRQLDVEIDVSYKTIYLRVQRSQKALDAPRPHLEGPIEIDELYVKAGLKGCERDCWSRSRGLSTRGRGTYAEDKPPVFILADRGSGDRYVFPAKAADESTVRFLLAVGQQESLTIYTDGFRAYEPLDENDAFDRKYVVHSDGEYVNGDVHVNTCESHTSLT